MSLWPGRRERPRSADFLPLLFDGFLELHGDRCFRDDPSVIGGLAFFEGQPVTVIAQEKGHGTKENVKRNFGMVSPEGYRKARRLMKQAENFTGRFCFSWIRREPSAAWKQKSGAGGSHRPEPL